MVLVDGDKSIAHRAVLLSLLADDPIDLTNVPASADVASSIAAVAALGVGVERRAAGLRLHPAAALREDVVVDCGNAGTLARLLCGLLVGRNVPATLTGDASLSRRPMRRATTPLALFLGADVVGLTGGDGSRGTLPARLGRRPAAPPARSRIALDVPSAQVKSALLLCALSVGDIVVVEPRATRDHTERLLASLGVAVTTAASPAGGIQIEQRRPARLPGFTLSLPGDPSSAAFLLGRAAPVVGARVVVEDVLLSPRRDGFLRALRRAGADVNVTAGETRGGEVVGRVAVTGARLRGLDLGADEIPDLVDEVPLLAALLATAEGPSRLRGLGELRVKESDRLAATTRLLRAFGADARVDGDDLLIAGGLTPRRAARADDEAVLAAVDGDHRLEMTAQVLARIVGRAVRTDGDGCEAVSFPRFGALLDEVEACL
jgi:3-phosphoshikimate 1-carboxyvinyltransferase